MSRSFKYKDKIYDLPEDKVESFLSKATDAFEVKSYKYNDKIYDLPLDKVESFLSKAPNTEFIGEESTPDPFKKKEESVSAEPLPDFYTNTTGQTSTEADPVLQSFQEQDPLSVREMGRGEERPMPVEEPSGVPTFAKRQEEEWEAPLLSEEQPQPQYQDPLGVRETFGMGEPENYSQYLEENPSYFDEGMAYAIDSEVPTIERTGTRQSSERFYKPEDLKEESAWNYFKQHRGNLAPHQLAVLEGALERNAPKKYAQYRLEKYRANKDRTNQEWVKPEDTIEYLELKNDYGQSDEMLKLLKEGKNQTVLDMLSNLDKQGLLNEAQSKGVQKILSSEDQEDKTLDIGGTFAPSPQMPQQKRWNFPIDSKATTSFIREIIKEGDYFEDSIKEDDNSFTRGRKGYKHAMHNATIALSKDKEDVIGYFEYLHQQNLRTEPKKQHSLFSMQGMLEMTGGVVDQTAISGGTGLLATAVGTPAAGVVAGTATAAGMSAYQGYGQSFEEAYSKARGMGINKEKSYEVAQLQAKAGAVGGAIEGTAGALVGAKVPTKGLLGKIGMFLLDPAVAGASKMGQNIYGESLGLDYTDFEGVPENMLGELMFGGAMTGVNVTGKQVFNWWKKLPSDQKIAIAAKVDQAKEASVETVEAEEVTPTVTAPDQPSKVVESKVLTQEESLEAQKDRDIQTVKDAIAEAEQTGQVPMINGREVSETTIDEINNQYEQRLSELQQETDATTQPTDVEEGLDTETTGTEDATTTEELEGTEQATGTGEGIGEADQTDTGGVVDGKSKTESDTDTTSKAEGTGRTGTTETEDTDGGQIEGEQSRTEGEDTKGDAVLPKEESTVQEPSAEIDKILDAPDLKNKGLTDEELNDKTVAEAFLKDSDAPKDDPVRKEAEDKVKKYQAKQKEFDDNYLKKFSTVRKAYNEIKGAFNKGKRGERTDIIDRLSRVKEALNQFIKDNKDSFKKVKGSDVPNISKKITNLNPRAKDLEGEIDRVVAKLEAILIKAEDNDLKSKIKKESTKLTNKFKNEKVKGYKEAINRAKYIVKNISKVKDKVSLAKAVVMLNESTSQSRKATVHSIEDINTLLDKAMSEEAISDTDYNNFLDNKSVSKETKQNIIKKIENKELLSPREREIFEDKDISFDEQITRLEAIADSKTKEMSDEDIELLDSKIRSFSERNLDTLSPEIKEKVEILSNIPLDSLSPNQKIKIVKALEKAVVNDSDNGIQGLIDLANGVSKGEEASKRITKTETRGWFSELVEKHGATWASFTQNLEAIANKNEASVLREVFLQPLQKAKASINKEFNAIMDSVTDVYHDIRKTDPAIDSNENIYERSIYSTLNMFIKGSNINERVAQFAEVQKLINNTVDYYKTHPRIAKEKNIDIDALEKVWNKYKGIDPYAEEGSAVTPDDIISDNNKRIVDAYKKEYETKLKDKIFEQNDRYKGEFLPEIENYLAVGVIKTKAKSQVDPEAGLDGFKSDNFNNMILSTDASSRKKRKIKYSKDDILDLNFDLVQERNINNTLQDLHLTSAFNEVNGALISDGLVNKLGRDRVDAVKRLADSWVREELGAYRKHLDSVFERGTRKLADLGYAVTLGTPEQAIKQSIPVLTSAAMNLGLDAHLLPQAAALLINPKTKGIIKEMMDKTDIGQRGFRKVENPDTKARIHRESNRFAREVNTKLSKIGFKEKINPTDLAMIFTELGDNASAKASWLAYYMSDLKKQGVDISNTGLSSSQKKRKATLENQLEIARKDEKGRYKGSKTDALGREFVEMSDVASIQKELDALNEYESKSWTGKFNDQAAAYASQQVSKTQNVSDQNERARLVKKGDEAAATPFVRNTLLSFQGFAINNKFRLANDIAKGNVKGITAAIAEDLIFNSLSGIIGKGMLGFATNAFLGAEDEGWDKRLDRAKKKAIMGIPKLLNPLNVAGGIGDDLLGDIVNNIAAYSEGKDLIEYLNDDPLYRNYDRDDKFGLYSLGLGVPIAIADDISILLSDTVHRDAYVGNKVVERHTAAAKKVALYHLVATALSVGVPVSQVERILRKEKERLLKEGKPSGRYSSGGNIRRSNLNVRRGSSNIRRGNRSSVRGRSGNIRRRSN